jgi:hypothetical protein
MRTNTVLKMAGDGVKVYARGAVVCIETTHSAATATASLTADEAKDFGRAIMLGANYNIGAGLNYRSARHRAHLQIRSDSAVEVPMRDGEILAFLHSLLAAEIQAAAAAAEVA